MKKAITIGIVAGIGTVLSVVPVMRLSGIAVPLDGWTFLLVGLGVFAELGVGAVLLRI